MSICRIRVPLNTTYNSGVFFSRAIYVRNEPLRSTVGNVGSDNTVKKLRTALHVNLRICYGKEHSVCSSSQAKHVPFLPARGRNSFIYCFVFPFCLSIFREPGLFKGNLCNKQTFKVDSRKRIFTSNVKQDTWH